MRILEGYKYRFIADVHKVSIGTVQNCAKQYKAAHPIWLKMRTAIHKLVNQLLKEYQMPNIKVLAGGGFVEQEVRAETICELREELDISSGASVAVNGSNKANSYSLQDGDLVAAVSNDKTGGDQ